MAIYRSDWHWFERGETSGDHTIEINLAYPQRAAAQVSLFGRRGGGVGYAGIKSYRRIVNGTEQTIDFGEVWYKLPPVIVDDIKSITVVVATGQYEYTWGTIRIDYWANN